MSEKARAAIAAIVTAAATLGDAKVHEQALVDGKAVEKAAAIRRIMQTENEETHKQHSGSSAEKIVEGDATYADYLAGMRGSVLATQTAWGEYEAAKLTATLEVSLASILSRLCTP